MTTHAYYVSHKKEIQEYKRRYRQTAHAKELKAKDDKKYYDSPNGRTVRRRVMAKYKKSSKAKLVEMLSLLKKRTEVINLYSNGVGVCMGCGGAPEHIHHVNPDDARHEIKIFGTMGNRQARNYQIAQYAKNPEYMKALCKQCHYIEHQNLRRL